MEHRSRCSQTLAGNGQNFTSTVLDDAALSSIANGIAPFTGTYQPTGKLSSLVGSNASGTWTLQILNSSKNTSGVLVNWSLNITPQITVTARRVTLSTEWQARFKSASRFSN